MAIEGTEQVVDQNGGGSTTTEQNTKPDGGTGGTQEQKTTSQPGTSTGQNEDYEKRLKGTIADLQKERAARQKFEKELAEERARYAEADKRIKALAGIETKSPEEEDDEQIRARLEKLGYPRLTQEDLDAIKEAKALQEQQAATLEHHWKLHGRAMVGQVYTALEKELGGKLSERQQKRILAEYIRTVESDPALVQRHEDGDPTLASEIAKQLSEDFIEPARRKVTQQETQRFRAVPSGKDRGIVTHQQQKIDVNDPKAVEDVLVKGFLERNGSFSGRR